MKELSNMDINPEVCSQGGSKCTPVKSQDHPSQGRGDKGGQEGASRQVSFLVNTSTVSFKPCLNLYIEHGVA